MNINNLGIYGPHLMMMMSLPFLWTKRILLNYTAVGIVLSVMVNVIMKFMFHHQRPDTNIAEHRWRAVVSKTTLQRSIEYDPYGFPSGHSQTAAFLAAMMYYSFGLKPITIIMLAYSLFIMAQRVCSGKHYLYQVIGGAILGVVLATGVYYSYKNQLVGHIIHKLDDWSRIF